MSYEEDQADWIRETGIKVGDKVRVICAPEPGWRGHGFEWGYEKQGTIGKEMYVCDLSYDEAIVLYYQLEKEEEGEGFTGNYYPFYILIKVDDDDEVYDGG